MNHTDKIVRIRETRDYIIPIYDEEDDFVAEEKAMKMVNEIKNLHSRVEKKIVSVDTRKWRDENG